MVRKSFPRHGFSCCLLCALPCRRRLLLLLAVSSRNCSLPVGTAKSGRSGTPGVSHSAVGMRRAGRDARDKTYRRTRGQLDWAGLGCSSGSARCCASYYWRRRLPRSNSNTDCGATLRCLPSLGAVAMLWRAPCVQAAEASAECPFGLMQTWTWTRTWTAVVRAPGCGNGWSQ